MNEATQITMPYTIAVYMVQDFLGPDASQTQISRLTGILVSCLNLFTDLHTGAVVQVQCKNINRLWPFLARRQQASVQRNLSPPSC